MLRKMLLGCSALGLAAAFAHPTYAQDAAGVVTSLDEIVVTARQRAESLQDVPLAVTAISGETLESRGVSQARDLFAATPGLYLSQSGQRQNDEQFFLTIRGVGSAPVVEPSVGVFVDGVYMPSLGWTADFLDLERIEILRGPQGALFGRNTEGGAVSIVTRKPGEELRGRAAIEAAGFGSYRATGAVSGPVGERLFAGISAFAASTDGYMRNVTRGEDQDDRERFGGRLILRALPTDAAEILFSVDYLQSEGRFDAFGDAVRNQAVTVVDPQAPAASRGTFLRNHALAGRRYTTYGEYENTVESRNYGAGLTINLEMDAAILTSISGYRGARSSDSYDNDGIATARSTNSALTKQRILSQELRLTSNGDGPLSWIVGAYGFSEKLRQDRISRFYSGVLAGPIAGSGEAFGFTSDNARIKREGVALFAQAAYKLTPELELALGARYAHEKVEQDPNLRVRVQIGPTVVDVANTTAKEKSFEGFSPSASLSYRVTPDLLVYASVATGFKGGGFTKEVPNTPLQNAALSNETSLNYELGLKGDAFDRALTFNAALFRTELKDQQLSTRIELSPGTGIYIPSTLNVGKGHSQGVEIEAVLRPTAELRVAGSLSYTDTQFDDYVASPATATLPQYNRKGQAFPETPKWLASVSAEYVFELAGGATLTPLISWRYVGDKFVGQGNTSIPFVTVEAHDLFDAQIAYAKGPWSLVGFVKNLTDDYYVLNRFQLQPATSAPGAQTYAKPGAPRQFGARLSYEF